MSELLHPDSDRNAGAIRYLQAVRTHWRLIALLVGLATAASVLTVANTPKRYEATADITVNPVAGNDDTFQGFSLFRQSFDGSSSVVTAARVLNSAQIRVPAKAALARAGVDASVGAEPLSQADIVAIHATASSADDAARGANIFADSAVATRTQVFQRELRDHISRLTRRANAISPALRATSVEYSTLAGRLGELSGFVGAGDPTVRVAARATPPSSPSWPRPKLTIAAAVFASLLLGVGLAVLLDVVNPRISREEELQLGLRLPILARIPQLPTRVAHGYLMGKTQLPGSAWKGYRTLRAGLAVAGADGSFPRTILVTSASPSDGKTMTSVNLAITLAAADMRVILVDADLHRPMIATIFNVGAPPGGFTALLTRRTSPDAALVDAPAHPRLRLLLSRREQAAQIRLFDSERIRYAIDELQRHADVVIFDAPPLTEVAEALEIAAGVDAVLVAVRLDHTRRDRLADLRDLLMRRGVSPVGLVVTTRDSASHDNSYDYYQGDLAAAPPAAARSRPRVTRST